MPLSALSLLAIASYVSATRASSESQCRGQQYNILPGFPTNTNGCHPINNYRLWNLGMTTPDTAQHGCQDLCTEDAHCGSFVAELKKVPNSDKQTGICFFYKTADTPSGPLACSETDTFLVGYEKDRTLECLSASLEPAYATCSSILKIPIMTVTHTEIPPVVTVSKQVIINQDMQTVWTFSSTVSKTERETTHYTATSTTVGATTTSYVTVSFISTATLPTTTTILLAAVSEYAGKKRQAAAATMTIDFVKTVTTVPPAVQCLPSTIPASRLSAACACLKVPTSTFTITSHAPTPTTSVTTTRTRTWTYPEAGTTILIESITRTSTVTESETTTVPTFVTQTVAGISTLSSTTTKTEVRTKSILVPAVPSAFLLKTGALTRINRKYVNFYLTPDTEKDHFTLTDNTTRAAQFSFTPRHELVNAGSTGAASDRVIILGSVPDSSAIIPIWGTRNDYQSVSYDLFARGQAASSETLGYYKVQFSNAGQPSICDADQWRNLTQAHDERFDPFLINFPWGRPSTGCFPIELLLEANW